MPWCEFMDLIMIHFPFLFLQVNSRMSKEEILNLLARKGDQVNRLEEKIAGELQDEIFKDP